MHNLPLGCMTYQMGMQIGSSMGNILEVDAIMVKGKTNLVFG